MNNDTPQVCPDCDDNVNRRRFLKSVGGAAIVTTTAPMLTGLNQASAAPSPKSKAESSVKRFFESLSEKQRGKIQFAFDHKLQHKVDANWHITKPRIGSDFFNNDQRELIKDIVRNVSSEDGYERLQRQMRDDANGIGSYSVAIFGEPGSDKPFEWVMTGRHLTLRADGNSVSGAAFGGPIVYGHGVDDPKKNLFFDQTKQANEVFKALDAPQAKQALLPTSPEENRVPLQGKGGKFPGVAVSDLSNDQKDLVEKTIKVLLSLYRKEDVDEVVDIMKKSGGLNKLHMAFYKDGDADNDKIWDVWRVEGPSLVWHFRGDPHVHAYINVGIKKS